MQSAQKAKNIHKLIGTDDTFFRYFIDCIMMFIISTLNHTTLMSFF